MKKSPSPERIPGIDTPLLIGPEAAEYLQITERLLRELVARREMPCVRVGGRLLRFRKADLDAYIAARVIPARRGPLSEVTR
jgi:excisionase family DNA binding protein